MCMMVLIFLEDDGNSSCVSSDDGRWADGGQHDHISDREVKELQSASFVEVALLYWAIRRATRRFRALLASSAHVGDSGGGVRPALFSTGEALAPVGARHARAST